MKSLMKLVLVFGFAAALVDILMRRAADRDARLPTLRAVEDADATRPEPLGEGDLKVAQNAPF
jgi:hypothetical protein